MSRAKKLAINTIILVFGTVVPKIGSFLVLPILTAVLTKAEYGTYDLILTSLSFILPIVSLQIEQASFRYLIDAENERERKGVITNTAAFICLSSVLLLLIGMVILKDYDIQVKLLIILYAVLELVYRYILQVCRGIGQLKKYSHVTIINSVFNVLLTIVLVGKVKMGLTGLLISLSAAMLAAILYGVAALRLGTLISVSAFDFKSLKELLKYSLPLMPNSLSWWVVSLSDRWIITSILGVEFNAVYAVSNKIPSLFNLIYNNFNLAWQESAARSMQDNDINAYYSYVFNYLCDFLTGVILLMITTSPVLFRIFIDKAYMSAYYQMPVLFIAMLFHSFASFYGGVYVAFKKSNELGLSAFFGALVNILINYVFIRRIGLYAASVSTLVSYLVITLFRALDVRKYVAIDYNLKKIAASLSIVVLVSAVSYINNFYLNIINFVFALAVSFVMNRKLFFGLLNKALSRIKKW